MTFISSLVSAAQSDCEDCFTIILILLVKAVYFVFQSDLFLILIQNIIVPSGNISVLTLMLTMFLTLNLGDIVKKKC